MNQKRSLILAALLTGTLLTLSAEARSIRVDSGDWNNSASINSNSTQSLGFSFDALGVTTSSADILVNGGIGLSAGGQQVNLMPFFGDAQSAAGNTIEYQFGVTNANFNVAGVDAGFRATWTVFGSNGSLLNQYQAAIWSLDGGNQFAFEFNYDFLLAGDDTAQIGYESTAAGLFDLAAELGLTFADYMGTGDDEFSNNCPNTPNALACNNYYDGNFGPSTALLPDFAGGYFRDIDTNGGDAQGRYFFLFDANGAVQVSEPHVLTLLALAIVALVAGRRRA